MLIYYCSNCGLEIDYAKDIINIMQDGNDLYHICSRKKPDIFKRLVGIVEESKICLLKLIRFNDKVYK